MANPTLNTVIAQARAILQDEEASEYRYDTPRLTRYLNDYIQETRRDYPDLFLGSLATAQDDLAGGADFPLGWEYVSRAASYVVGRCDTHEAEHAETGRAATMIALGQRMGKS